MDMSTIVVQERKTKLMERLINVWEKSVKSTHWFLYYNEINGIKKSVFYELQNVEHLLIAVNRKRLCVDFMGINQYKCDMLFIELEECGKGLGKRFINWGIKNLDICEVTVNEQNFSAIGFYEHIGFKIYKRTDFDEQGRSYPLLYMKLQAN